MELTLFEQMGGTYSQVGGYLLPNITDPEEERLLKSNAIIGKMYASKNSEDHLLAFVDLLNS